MVQVRVRLVYPKVGADEHPLKVQFTERRGGGVLRTDWTLELENEVKSLQNAI